MNWQTFLTRFLFCGLAPIISLYFFCRFSGYRWKLRWGILYALAAALLFVLETRAGIMGISSLLLELFLFSLFGNILLKGDWIRSFAAAALVTSVSSISDGIGRLLFFWIASGASPSLPIALLYFDMMQEIFRLLLLILFLSLILKYFHSSMMTSYRPISLVFVLPIFYISLVERAIRDIIYGNTIVSDDKLGIIFPVINHRELLSLQLFACFSLFFLLTAWQKLTRSLLREQTLQLLEQQANVQETYIQEARLREERTRSFRHDIKNHLTVLSELLKEGCTEQAYRYLINLRQLSSSLSYPVQTGNPAADALLRSKFAIAQQKHISLQWELQLPDHSSISDIDWCIILSNGMDNAIKANDDVAEGKKSIFMTGKKKGNFYLLSIENSCHESLNQEPEYGTGLSNIKAAMDRHHGIMEITVSNGKFKLNLFFILLQHPNDISRQRD